MTPYLGEIKLVPYNFAPVGWLICQGQILPISEYEALFALIGTTYGGDGLRTFQLPNLQSRIVMHTGPGYTLGMETGTESVTLNTQTLPSHSHVLAVSGNLGTKASPNGNYPAAAPDGLGYVYEALNGQAVGSMAPGAISITGGGEAHENRQPYLVLNYIIATAGIFPSQ